MTTPAAEYCACPGFDQLVERGIVKRAELTTLNSETGDLKTVPYVHFGPRAPRSRHVVFQYCPGCGKQVRVNAEFHEAHDQGT